MEALDFANYAVRTRVEHKGLHVDPVASTPRNQLPPDPPAHHLPMRVLAQMRHRRLGETGGHGHFNLHLEPTLASWHPRMARPRALAQASVERPRDNSAGHLVKACWSVTATAPGHAAALNRPPTTGMRSYSARAAPGRMHGGRDHEASHRAHHQLTSWQWPRPQTESGQKCPFSTF